MARDDITPWNSPNGGIVRAGSFQMDTAGIWARGEPVGIDGGGQANLVSTDPDSHQVVGIAAHDVGTGSGGTVSVNWRTGLDFAAGDECSVILFQPGQYWFTANVDIGGGGPFADSAPLITHIGEGLGLTLISDVWGVDFSLGTADMIGQCVDVLDTNLTSISSADFDGTGVGVVFVINAGLGATDGNLADTA